MDNKFIDNGLGRYELYGGLNNLVINVNPST